MATRLVSEDALRCVGVPGGSTLLELPAGNDHSAEAAREQLVAFGDGGDDALFARVALDVVGHGMPFTSPYGEKRLLYADWTASGRALHSFEEILQRDVLPLYANAHTTTSLAGLQASAFQAEARAHVAAAVNARVEGAAEHGDVVLWAGSGATGAIDRLIRILGLERGGAFATDPSAEASLPPSARAVVLVGPWEHHSNLLPWRESAALVVPIGEGSDGRLCQRQLKEQLLAHRAAPLLVGAFSAASNVTGLVEDVGALSALLHEHGCVAVWDYAAAAPHGLLDMNPAGAAAAAGAPTGSAGGPPRARALPACLDAAAFSAHKLPGGVGAPGVLVVKRALLQGTHAPTQRRLAANAAAASAAPCAALPGGGARVW